MVPISPSIFAGMSGLTGALGFGGSFGSLGSALISSAASLVPSVGGDLLSSRLNYKYNKRLQDRAFKHQIKMYKNAHQWEVADLRKAGLNPILSANGNSAFASAPMTSVSVPSFGDNFVDPVDQLVKLQGFSSSRDAQAFARENHEIDLATKEAHLAGLEANFLKTLAEIGSINSSAALNEQLYNSRDNPIWSELQTIGPIMSTFNGGHSAVSVGKGTSKTSSKGKKFVSGLLDPEAIFSGAGRLYYLNKLYDYKKRQDNFLRIEKKMPDSVFTRYKYKYHNK